jgi:hypothetical protein
MRRNRAFCKMIPSVRFRTSLVPSFGKRITAFVPNVVPNFFLDLTRVKQWLADRQRDNSLHQVIEALFAFTLDIMAGQIVDGLSPIRENSFDPAVDSAAHRIFKVQSADIFSQQCCPHQTLKSFIPQTIQPLLRALDAGFSNRRHHMDSIEKVANWDFIRAFNDEARIQFKARYSAEGDEANAKFLVVGEELTLPRELLRDFLHLVGNRIVGSLCLRIARSRGAKQVAQLLATALSRAKGIGIVEMLIGILQIEIIEVDAPIRLLKCFRIRIS